MAINFDGIKGLPAKLVAGIKGFFGRFGLRSSSGGETQERGYAQLIGQVLAFVLFVAITFWVIGQVRVNGPVFTKILSYQTLRSDVLPPTMSTTNAFAALNEAYIAGSVFDNVKRDQKMAEVAVYEKQFKERAEYWRAHLDSKERLDQLEEIIREGDNFFRIAKDQFAPALPMGTVASAAPLGALTASYGRSQAAVDQFVATLEKDNKALVDSQTDFVKIILIALAVLAVLIVFFMVVFGQRQVKQVNETVKKMADEGQANQEAVLNLLDEMGDLADGDLTVKAQVAENITGAIADSINYTIDSLRDLVTEINRATEQVNQATAQAQATSADLLNAAEQQSKQIVETGEAVSNMTRSILQVSSNAGQASQVAQRSLKAATEGSQAVQNTISGMNEIRTQIQETSKRIKRLGESSQEISEIVELISDITEQTNILALNAAIQAASAGEAGRGFTVVAEEVQRLAERSSEATKQISAIVKTIQTDTSGAVAAMEKSTEGVVEGARLSDVAGQALNEIETVTNNLARLIEAISTATVAQTEVAATVSRNMQQIQNITSQTTEGTKLTAQSVGQLTSLAEELSASVAGFKLS
ncbi:MAG TPA: methyl-accepting chemotaxis protein [Methylophilaceae bacterium]|jgi:twitching motility protein PilJ